MLNEPTHKRLLTICTKLSEKQAVSDFDLVWAQKNAIHDEESAELLKQVGLFIPVEQQEDNTEV